MSITMNWLRVKGVTSPFSYRVYGPPQVGPGGPSGTTTTSAHTIYCIPWMTGQGGTVNAMHSKNATVTSNVVGHWGVYAATHTRLVTPNGLLVATSFNMTATVQSVAVSYVFPNKAMHYLAFACNTQLTGMACYPTADLIYPVLGVDSRGLAAHWGIAASYNVTTGLPATFPQTGWTFCGGATSHRPPFLGIHYA